MTEAEILELLALYQTAERKVLEGNQSYTVAGVNYDRANIYALQKKIESLQQQLVIVRNNGSYGCQPISFSPGGR